MTENELNDIRNRASRATPGPWQTVNEGKMTSSVTQSPGGYGKAITGWGRVLQWNADAEFIAHARTDVPALVEQVKRLREIVLLITGTPATATDFIAEVQRRADRELKAMGIG